MLIKVFGAAVQGIDATLITIEVNSSRGCMFYLVGLPDSAVKESHQRIISALLVNGYKMPTSNIVVNMAPADIRKEGSAYDLPLAIGLLGANETISSEKFSRYLLMGELSLDGSIQPIKGALPIAIKAREDGFEGLIIPQQNAREAAVVNQLKVYGVSNIKEVVEFFNNKRELEPTIVNTREEFYQQQTNCDLDFADVKGQENVKRALEVAAAGGHNLIMVGAPGSGKSMMAKRLPSILPPLSLGESLETTKIHSVAGLAILAAILLKFIAGNRKLKKSVKIANEHNELKTKFIQNISSQMEPTLNTLATSANELLQKAPQEASQMQSQVAALKKFSDDIQELSSLENSLTELYELGEINVGTFCENVMDKVKEHIKIDVTPSVNAPKLQVKTNKEQLERILLYLLKNAAYYTEQGRISLEFKKRGAHTHQFIVTDTGIGIPAEQQENIFKPFTEVKDLTTGDGLGLPICSLIAAKMNGSLTLDTSYTKGTRFILELHV